MKILYIVAIAVVQAIVDKPPANCTSWYDGCNICSVKDGIVGTCTSKYCTQKGKAHCMSEAKAVSSEDL